MTTRAEPATPPNAPPAWLPVAAVGCTLVLWASAFVAIRHLGRDFSPGALSLGRLLVGSVALGAIASVAARRRGVRWLPRATGQQWASVAVIGVLWFGVYNVALNEGELRVDAGTAAMLIQVSPVLIAVLAAAVLDEPFTRWLAAGLVVAFAGVVLIATSSAEAGDRDVLGVVLCLVSALAYTISLVVQKPLLRSLSALQVTWLACTVGAVVCLPWGPALVREVAAAPASSTWWVVYLGLFPTAVAFTTYAVALSHLDASRLAVSTYLVPPITIVLGLVLLGESPPPAAYLGGALTLIGVAVARRRPASAA